MVTVVTTTSKIDVRSTGGVEATLEEIFNAIGDSAVMSRTGSDPYVYQIHRSTGTYREFEISSGCIVRFEANDTLNWEGITNTGTYTTFDMASGSIITIEEGFTFDLNSDGQTYARAYISNYATLTIEGVEGNPVIFQKYRSFYDYSMATQDCNWVEFKNPTLSSGYMYYRDNYSKSSTNVSRSWRNVKVHNDNGNYWGYLYFTTSPNATNDIYENWEITHNSRNYFYTQAGKFKEFYFHDTTYGITSYAGGVSNSNPYQTSKSDTRYIQKGFQPYLMFEDCTFGTANSYSYPLYMLSNGLVYFKNCSFEDETYGLFGNYACRVLEYGDSTTFTNITTDRYWGADTTYLRCREIDITVVDHNGDPIENACVSLSQQPDNKEKWSGFTNDEGKLLNVHDNPALLVEREQTSKTNFANWSNDESGETAYHTIQVSKKGYGMQTINLEVTEDKTIEVVLYPASDHRYTLIDSVLYDTTIY